MTTTNLPPKPGLVYRYGPLTGIVIALALVAALVTVAGGEGENDAAQTVRTGEGGPATDTPVPFQQAQQDGRANSIDWGDNCDPATGRVKLPSIYAFPCVPRFTGDNGGTTGNGITGEEITVVWFLPPESGDFMAALAGNLDPREATRDTVTKFVEMLNATAETYGRRVKVEFFESKAASGDALAARAEAQQVIDQYKPFASINGPALTPAYAEELAAQGVLCVNCGTSLPDSAYQQLAPYLWGVQASPEQWLTIVSAYISRRLANRPAEHAGDPALRSSTRKFGIVNFEQDPPQFGGIASTAETCRDTTGWQAAIRETYLLTEMASRAPTIIAKLKAERITSVIFMGDPLMPETLTKEATKQGYFPEWIVTGTVLTDIAVFGRRYDPRQWENAFGLSQLAVSIPREQADGWRLHQWYFGTPPRAEKTSAIIWPPLQLLFNGIHMAGPNLNPETFKQGLFNLPPAGGGPTTPRISYGDRNIFPVVNPDTCELDSALTDYLATDDMVEVWWDPTVIGPDEQGSTAATGKYRYANQGRRYLPGDMPETDADAFKLEGSVVEFPVPPAGDRPPEYPPPRR